MYLNYSDTSASAQNTLNSSHLINTTEVMFVKNCTFDTPKSIIGGQYLMT